MLNERRYAALRFRGPGTDLTVGLADDHEWQGGATTAKNGVVCNANIPTEEVFTTPHRDRVDGVVRSTKPLSYQGTLIEDIAVRFEKGAIVEATAFKSGIVIAQVNEQVERVARVDVPADWVDFFVVAPRPNYVEPLFTRDPAQITEIQVLMAMMAIKGIYAEYGVQRLNHGIGFDTAAIELLLPTYGEALGLR